MVNQLHVYINMYFSPSLSKSNALLHMTRGYCRSLRGQKGMLNLLVPSVGACGHVWYGRNAPQALSPSQCPQLRTLVRDDRGKSFCSCEMEVRVAIFPARSEWVGASNSCWISPMTQAERGRREGPLRIHETYESAHIYRVCMYACRYACVSA